MLEQSLSPKYELKKKRERKKEVKKRERERIKENRGVQKLILVYKDVIERCMTRSPHKISTLAHAHLGIWPSLH